VEGGHDQGQRRFTTNRRSLGGARRLFQWRGICEQPLVPGSRHAGGAGGTGCEPGDHDCGGCGIGACAALV